MKICEEPDCSLKRKIPISLYTETLYNFCDALDIECLSDSSGNQSGEYKNCHESMTTKH